MTNEQPPPDLGRASPDESNAEDEGYDEGAGDRITPEDERETEPEGEEDVRQVPPSSSRHLPEDMPPET
ncbi:hypothetical protein [Haloactinomyces albus]|uniref:Uncharacterized protein n=1 Tax=Haloactinomyces albus TaxID=1352928 RepID=A0AAE3ZHT3_9ACTN|nr:hypothetical protein [Haloactinomyces albus]MDR7304305.1 hypothetical protein [Haloactinomyces albus]